ncbi:MAG: hypothetical protein M3Y87_22910 [Myxococcota bacterium]|nr:hypothetical protein [Myxococcota bacterium]
MIPSSPSEREGDAALGRMRGWLIAFAIVQRVAYWLESTSLPFMGAPLFDSAVYLRQAEAIRSGRFDDVTLVAFSPLYGWFLALFGDGAMLAQLALGVASAVLVERIARRHSPRAGLIAMALWLGYSLTLFYETKIMSETLGIFLLLGALALMYQPGARPSRILAGGAVLGLAVLARANLLFALPFFVLAMLVAREDREGWRPRALRTGALALGIALVLGANGLWNLAWFDRFVPVILPSRTASLASASGEWTGSLAIFQTSDAPPGAWDVVEQAEITLGRVAPPAASEPSPAVTSIDLGGVLRSAPSKLARTFSDVETTFEYGFYGERTELASLRWQPISFATLLVLGLLGAILLARARGWRALIAHAPLVIGVILVTTLFHPSSRYRLPMIVPLVMLGGIGLAELWSLPARRARIAIGSAVLVVCAALAIRHWTHALHDPAMWHVRVAEGETVRGDTDAARARVTRAYELSREGDAARTRIELLRRARALPPPPPP